MLLMFSSAVMLQILLSVMILIAHNNKHNDAESSCLMWVESRANELSRLICQSMEYCYRRDMGTLGAQANCHPQYVLRRYFRLVGRERELEWCRNMRNMDGPGLRRGIDMMLFGNGE